jgi:hypothetical protein
MTRSRSFFVAVAVVALVVLLPNSAFAARACRIEIANTPAERAELVREALDTFTEEHPNLTAQQTEVLAQLGSLGEQIAVLHQDLQKDAAFVRNATRIVGRAREVFSNSDLGRLFTDMGETQVWLAQMVAATPYCNCSGAGSCTFSGGPTGTCSAGCVSWDGDGTRYDGICSAASAE